MGLCRWEGCTGLCYVDFFLQHQGLFRGCVILAFHRLPALWMILEPLLVPSTLLCYSVVFCSVLKIPSNRGGVNGSFPQSEVCEYDICIQARGYGIGLRLLFCADCLGACL